MEQSWRKNHVAVWVARFGWLMGGALAVLAGFWIVPPCVTHRLELINTESHPANLELSLVTGWGETPLWRGELGSYYVRKLAFDLGNSEGHYRLKGRFAGSEASWDREFVYVTIDYGMETDVILVGSDKVETRRSSDWRKCALKDIPCAAPEIAALAIRATRCMVKGREPW